MPRLGAGDVVVASLCVGRPARRLHLLCLCRRAPRHLTRNRPVRQFYLLLAIYCHENSAAKSRTRYASSSAPIRQDHAAKRSGNEGRG